MVTFLGNLEKIWLLFNSLSGPTATTPHHINRVGMWYSVVTVYAMFVNGLAISNL